MSDEGVHAALRSGSKLVLIEAPAGCGKTHQGSEYAREIAESRSGRVLILTHTHAACSVFASRTKGTNSLVEIRTVDSLIGQIATAYHLGLGLPPDATTWARLNKDGYAHLALKVSTLIKTHRTIASFLAKRYPTVICDEHQDCSGDQHAISMALLDHGALVRIFADPMQRIFRDTQLSDGDPAGDWEQAKARADSVEQLDTPHRWSTGSPELGRWTLQARDSLKSGGKIDLRGKLPAGVSIAFAENQAMKNFDYQLTSQDRRPIDAFERSNASLLVLTRYNDTARSLRSFFNRRLLLWEGHTRSALESLASTVTANIGNAPVLASAAVKFMNDVGKGFSPSAFGDRLEKEVQEGCTAKSRGKPALIQELARCLLSDPSHKGVAEMLRRLAELKKTTRDFSDIEVDHLSEFWDAVRLGTFDSIDKGLLEIIHRRVYSRPSPPDRAISTIHKAKGLECNDVIVMPCDARTFPDNAESRCLLYVALSRAKRRLLLIISRGTPSPLLNIG